MTADEIQAEVNGLKNLLTQTDYKAIRTIEQFFLLFEGGITFTKLLSGVTDLIAGLVDGFKERQTWRDRINELEATEAEEENEQPGESAEDAEAVSE